MVKKVNQKLPKTTKKEVSKKLPLTKKLVVSKPKKTSKLTTEEKFWDEVEVRSKDLIANLIERNLPISAIPSVFDLEKDVNYRVLLRDDITQSYYDHEEYQEKIANRSWTEEDVEQVAQEVTMWYFRGVLKGIIADISDYWCYENHFFENLTSDEY